MNDYFVGNILRGFFYFQAEEDETAWAEGKKIFAAHYPSDSGRQVMLMRIMREGLTDPGQPLEVPKHQRAWF